MESSPSRVYDLAANAGWVSVGIDHDTAAFAVAAIRRWWERAGRSRSPAARRLLITGDGGGSTGARTRRWKWELQRLADATGLAITVCHFPPGTSQCNTIEHRLFPFVSQNWRGKPLVSYAVILSLIAATTTATGLTIASELDTITTRPASGSLTSRWPPSAWRAMPSMASGTTPSAPTPPDLGGSYSLIYPNAPFRNGGIDTAAADG